MVKVVKSLSGIEAEFTFLLQFLNGLQLPAGLPVFMHSVAQSGCRLSNTTRF